MRERKDRRKEREHVEPRPDAKVQASDSPKEIAVKSAQSFVQRFRAMVEKGKKEAVDSN